MSVHVYMTKHTGGHEFAVPVPMNAKDFVSLQMELAHTHRHDTISTTWKKTQTGQFTELHLKISNGDSYHFSFPVPIYWQGF